MPYIGERKTHGGRNNSLNVRNNALAMLIASLVAHAHKTPQTAGSLARHELNCLHNNLEIVCP